MMRIDKYLAYLGFGSRKDVKQLIKMKRVSVNGEIIKKDDIKINEESDQICVDDELCVYEKTVYYMLNKPSGVVSATMDDRYKTVLECIDDFMPKDAFPVGRLDLDTEGLLLITNDGALAHDLLSPKKHVDKCYYVECKLELTDDMIQILENDIHLKTEDFLPGKVTEVNKNTCKLIIQEGKFHQVKKMMIAAGNEVTYLKRISMGSLVLDENLKPGEYRKCTIDEIERLRGK